MTAKIMLVEDDTNLSDIYKARFEAEGFQVTAAKDGEEALALAVKEKPDLIISDIMMPKISGFDMLDILRSTDGIKYTKVIMMTALGQNEDKARAEKLGADRYLVKSQVTLEDVVRAVHEVLSAKSTTSAPATNPQSPSNATGPTPNPSSGFPASPTAVGDDLPAITSVPNDTNAPSVSSGLSPTPTNDQTDQARSDSDNKTAALAKIRDFVNQEEANSQAKADDVKAIMKDDKIKVQTSDEPAIAQGRPVGPDYGPANDHVSIVNKKVITPLNNIHPDKAELEKALALEEAKEKPELPPVVHGTGINAPVSENQVDQGHLTL